MPSSSKELEEWATRGRGHEGLLTATMRGVLGGCYVLSNRAAVRTPGNCLHRALGYT